MVSDEVLEKDKEWIEKHGDFLSDEEKNIINYIDSINEITVSFESDSKKEASKKEKIKTIFKELEEQIDNQKEELLKLKKGLFIKHRIIK